MCVSLREIITRVGSYPANELLYSRFPIQDIISKLLSELMRDPAAGVFLELEERFPDKYDDFDVEVLAIFFDTLIEDIDKDIMACCESYIDTSEYIFDRWVGDYDLVLRNIKNGYD